MTHKKAKVSQKVINRGYNKNRNALSHLKTNFTVELQKLIDSASSGINNREALGVLRKFHSQAFLLGQNSRMLSPKDKKWVQNFVNTELKYLKKFLADVANERSRMNITTRRDMYVNTLEATFDSGAVFSLPANTVIDWKLGPTDKNCPQCKYLADNSPYTPDTLPVVPRSGSTVCKSNCKCSIKTRVLPVIQYLRVKMKSKPRNEHLAGLRNSLKKRK